IYLHALNIVEPLYVSLVMRTRGLIQASVDFTELEQRRRLSVKYTGFAEIDWVDQFDDAFLTWIEGGVEVVEAEVTEEIYLQNYLHHYAARRQLRGGARVRHCSLFFNSLSDRASSVTDIVSTAGFERRAGDRAAGPARRRPVGDCPPPGRH